MTLTRPGPGSDQDGLPSAVERRLQQELTIWSWDRVIAARVPKLSRVDVFAPEVVVWSYESAAEPTVRALLNLVHPRHPDAPAGVYPAPRSLRVPRHRQRPMSIRLPSASQIGARGARLTGLQLRRR